MGSQAAVLSFNEELHEYRLDGRVVPSVTQIIEAVGLISYANVPEQKLADCAWKGSAIHAACQYLDEGTLDWRSVEPEHLPYVRAWQRFRDESGFVVDAAEELVCNRVGYAGRLDRRGRLRDGSRAVLDLKTGCVMPATRLQLAAYVMSLEQPYTYARYAVRLTAERRFSVTCYPKRDLGTDYAVFLHALGVYCWRKENV